MGNTCCIEDIEALLVNHYSPDSPQQFTLARNEYSRFGDVEKIRTKQSQVYKLIMASNTAVMQTITVECRILSSSADFELYPPAKMQVRDLQLAPIFDPYDTNSHKQVYHKILSQEGFPLTMKVYTFCSLQDVVLKHALNEIHVYQSLVNGPLLDYFIMSRGSLNTMVLIFKNYQVNLQDVLRYRAQIKRPYLDWELAVVCKGLISNYKQLMQQNIVHRDIRLQKILFCPNNPTQPYQFANLQSARKLQRHSAKDELLTVRGVDQTACQPIKQKIQQGEIVALYDALRYDLDCLIKVLRKIEEIGPYPAHKYPKNFDVIEQLKKPIPNFNNAQGILQKMIKKGDPDRTVSIRDDKAISKRLIQVQLRRVHKERIWQANFQCLLAIHNKVQFNKVLMNQMEQNQKLKRKQRNLRLLHRVGQYYQNIGLGRNEYYQEEVSLLLELAKECRLECFYIDFRECLQRAQSIHKKHNINHEGNRVRIQLEKLHNLMLLEQKDQTNKKLSLLINLTDEMKEKDPALQMEVLQAKVLVYVKNAKFPAAQNILINMSSLLEDEKQFQLVSHTRGAKAQLEWLWAYYHMQTMKENRSQISSGLISKAQMKIKNARQMFAEQAESPQNTIKIIDIHLLHSELYSFMEEYTASRKQACSAQALLQDLQNQQERNVSADVKQRVLKRVKEAYLKEGALSQHYQLVLKTLDHLNLGKQGTNAQMHARNRRKRKLAQIYRSRLSKNRGELASIQERGQQEEEFY